MTTEKTSACVEAYRRLKNLKLVAVELDIPWQTVYVHLKQAGEPVNGDKQRYGSDKDRLAARAEREFLRLVPAAIDFNRSEFQAKVDFSVHGLLVDVKSSRLRFNRYAFSLKKQELVADFFVCFGFDVDNYRVLLIPGDICRNYQSVSASVTTRSKWWDYEVSPNALNEFFDSLRKAA